MRTSPLLLAGAGAFLIAGCGGSGSGSSATRTGATTTVKTPASKAQIDFQVTGGIAGVNQKLSVAPDGRANVTTGFRQGASKQRFQLSDTELADLRDKLVAADIGHLPKPPPSGCSDCFEYSIQYLGLSYRADQISIPKPLQPAIAALTKLVSEHGSGNAPTISGK